jgi:hypothetical protein
MSFYDNLNTTTKRSACITEDLPVLLRPESNVKVLNLSIWSSKALKFFNCSELIMIEQFEQFFLLPQIYS